MNHISINTANKLPIFCVIALLLAACNGSTSSSSAATSQNSSSTTTAQSPSNNSSAPATATSSLLSIPRLTSITNYSYSMQVGTGGASLTMTGQIHSSTDFEISLGTTHTFYVDGQAYEVLGTIAPQKITLNQGYFQQQGIVAAANTFIGLTKASGVTIKATGTCNVAGITGTSYTESTPASVGILKLSQIGCVANSGGALLSFVERVSGSATPGGGGQKYFFEITGVNNVPQIPAP